MWLPVRLAAGRGTVGVMWYGVSSSIIQRVVAVANNGNGNGNGFLLIHLTFFLRRALNIVFWFGSFHRNSILSHVTEFIIRKVLPLNRGASEYILVLSARCRM